MTLPYLAVHRSGFGSRSIPARFAPRGSTHKLVPMSSSQSMFLPTITPWPLSFHITRVHTACPPASLRSVFIPWVPAAPPAHRGRLITPGDYAPSSACEPQPALPVHVSAGATRTALAPARSPSAPLPAGDVGAGAPHRGHTRRSGADRTPYLAATVAAARTALATSTSGTAPACRNA